MILYVNSPYHTVIRPIIKTKRKIFAVQIFFFFILSTEEANEKKKKTIIFRSIFKLKAKH